VYLRGSESAGILILTPQGPASPLAESVIERMRTHAHFFQFKTRLIVNFENVSVLVTNLPLDDEALAGRVRDHAAMVAETAQLALGHISFRADALARAEGLHALAESSGSKVEALLSSVQVHQKESCSELEQMVGRIEDMYYKFGLSDEQEDAISDVIRAARDEVLSRFERHGMDLEQQLTSILDGLNHAGDYRVDMEENAKIDDELWE